MIGKKREKTDMENNNNSAGSGSQGNFLSGFLIGALLGAAVVFLLGTKKGKRLLKVISDEGIDNISNILEQANKAADLDEVYEKEEEILPKREIVVKEKFIEDRPKVRRFFRGISRRLN